MLPTAFWHFASQDLDGPLRLIQEVGRALDNEASRMSFPRLCEPFVDQRGLGGRFDPYRITVIVAAHC